MSAPAPSGLPDRLSTVLLRARHWLVEPPGGPTALRPPDAAADLHDLLPPAPPALAPRRERASGFEPRPEAAAESMPEAAARSRTAPDEDIEPDPLVVAVVGLAARCGTTTIARWLAALLAARDPAGAAIVAGPDPRGTGSLRTAAAGRLARALEGRSIAGVRTAGRLCLADVGERSLLDLAARGLAPLVLDIGHGTPPASAARLADGVVLVAPVESEPALAAVVAASIARDGPEPFLVVNRAREPGPWERRAAMLLPTARLAAHRAAAGREPRGVVGDFLEDLVEALEASAFPGEAAG